MGLINTNRIDIEHRTEPEKQQSDRVENAKLRIAGDWETAKVMGHPQWEYALLQVIYDFGFIRKNQIGRVTQPD